MLPMDLATTQRAMGQLVDSLTQVSAGPGLLQRWACHASAAPVLMVLLQVLTYRDFAARTGGSSKDPKEELIQQKNILSKESEHRLLNGLQVITSLPPADAGAELSYHSLDEQMSLLTKVHFSFERL